MAVDILCVGVVVADAVGLTIDSFPEEGSLMVFDRVEMHLGGCPANTAVGLARLGIRAGVAAKVGRDGLGDFIRNTLKENGVDVSGVKADPHVATSFSFIMVPKGGNRRIYHTFGANGIFSPDDVDFRIFKGPEWVAFGCLSLMPKLFGKNLATLLKAAHKAGAKTAGDTAFNSKLKHWDAVFKGCLEHFDVFFPSEEEAVKVTGLTKPRDIVKNLRDRGVKIAGVKLGARGCVVFCDDGYEEIPAYKVKCVDTLGAGDSFFAGFLAGLHKGRNPFDAARLGCAVAAHSVQAVGATTGIPKLAMVEAFMKRQGN